MSAPLNVWRNRGRQKQNQNQNQGQGQGRNNQQKQKDSRQQVVQVDEHEGSGNMQRVGSFADRLAKRRERAEAFRPREVMRRGLNLNQYAAICVWLAGAYTTSLALEEMGVKGVAAYLLGIALQLVFTRVEAPLWSTRSIAFIPVAVTAIDIAFNFGGAWPITKNIDQTSMWSSFTEALEMGKAAPALSKVVFTLITATATAAGPEWLWNQD